MSGCHLYIYTDVTSVMLQPRSVQTEAVCFIPSYCVTKQPTERGRVQRYSSKEIYYLEIFASFSLSASVHPYHRTPFKVARLYADLCLEINGYSSI